MKATDLRIGNIVQRPYDKTTHVVSGYLEPYVYLGFEGKGNYYSHRSKLEPIPLTEQWLERFGFYKDYENDYYSYWSLYGFTTLADYGGQQVLVAKTDKNYTHFRCGYYENEICCEHVHQLQNLYHALTGEELTLKEDV